MWKAWERHVILAYDDDDNDLTDADRGDREFQPLPPDDVDNRVDLVVDSSRPADGRHCSARGLEQSLNELQLARVELRGRGDDGSNEGRSLLYLGDVHTDRAQRPYYRPQSYQLPLVADDVRPSQHLVDS